MLTPSEQFGIRLAFARERIGVGRMQGERCGPAAMLAHELLDAAPDRLSGTQAKFFTMSEIPLPVRNATAPTRDRTGPPRRTTTHRTL
jgi:hypothetical protein